MTHFWITLISGLLVLAGVAGSILPFLPGLPVSLLGLLIFAWYTHFAVISVTALVIFVLLVGLTILFDVFAPALAARGHKASGFGSAGAIFGTIVGMMVFGPAGILIGPFLGAFIGELANTGVSTERALKVAYAAVIGMLLGSLFKLIVGFSMIVYFLFKMI